MTSGGHVKISTLWFQTDTLFCEVRNLFHLPPVPGGGPCLRVPPPAGLRGLPGPHHAQPAGGPRLALPPSGTGIMVVGQASTL